MWAAAALVLAGVGVVTVSVVAGPVAPASAAPLGCTTGLYYASGPNLYQFLGSGTPTAIATNPTVDLYSAAYNEQDGNVYAVVNGSNRIYRVEADGTTTDLGVPAGLPLANYPSAGFDGNGLLWLGRFGNVIDRVDVTTMTHSTLTLSAPVSVGDMTWMNGIMYAVGNGRLITIDGATGAVTTTGVIPGLNAFAGAAVWAASGHLYTQQFGSLFEVIGYDTPTPTVVSLGSTSPNPLDGAACASAPSPFLNAADDDFTGTAIRQNLGGVAGNVYVNDTRNTVAFTATDVIATVVDDGGATGAAIVADGGLALPAGLPAGEYSIQYQICATDAAGLCDTATAKVVVSAPSVIVAADDDFTAAAVPASGGVAGNVLTNDTLSGNPIIASQVELTLTADGGLTGVVLGADGTVTVPAEADAGVYDLAYSLCEVDDPTNCDTATVMVRVDAAPAPTPAPTATAAPAPVSSQGGTRALAATGSALDGSAIMAGVLLLLAGGTLFTITRKQQRTRGRS